MAIQQSDAQRNARLDSISTTWAASPKMRIYSGTPPSDETAALSGNTLLVEWTLTPASASAGSKNMAGSVPLAGAAAAAGTAAFYRVYNNAGSTPHEQGTVTATGGGGDATIDNVVIASGQTVNLTAFTKTEPG